MKKIIILLFLKIFFFQGLNAQDEKRLALVIGNANYDRGELKNPVNDARLIASTLDSLNFDVILKENLATKRDMTGAIREFGSKRSEYDVAFVYYAGHGIQVDDENFLLPTKEIFEEEFDVMDYGVSVQNIMRYLRAESNEVNILILDACRDNPFESNWSATRSLKGGGLAKIPPPTGSLIAFSTDSGQTAPDGDGENSIYTTSLAKNMLKKDISVDQVFRNVRSEVLAETNGNQRPVEATQLTGQAFYLNPGNFEKEFRQVEKNLIDKSNLEESLDILKIILKKDSLNSKAFTYKGHVNKLLNNTATSVEDYQRSIELDSLNLQSYYSLIFHNDGSFSYGGMINIYSDGGSLDSEAFQKSNLLLDKLYKLNRNNPFYYRMRAYNEMLTNGYSDNFLNLVNYGLEEIKDEDIIYFYNEHTLSSDNTFNPIINFRTILSLRKMDYFSSSKKYQDVIDVQNDMLQKYKNVFETNESLKQEVIGTLATIFLDALYNLQNFDEYEKHARYVASFNVNEFRITGQVYLNKVLVLKGDFKEGLKNSTSVYEFMKNSNDIKPEVLRRFYYYSLMELLHFSWLIGGDDYKALEIINEFLRPDNLERFNIYDSELQTVYYYRYILNLLLNREKEALVDKEMITKIDEEGQDPLKLLKKNHNIKNPSKNSNGELFIDKLFEPKPETFISELIYFEKINYYFLLRNNLNYQNYLKLFQNNLNNKESQILIGFILNTLKYNLTNDSTRYY